MRRPQQNSGIYGNRQGVGLVPWPERPETHFLGLFRRAADSNSFLFQAA